MKKPVYGQRNIKTPLFSSLQLSLRIPFKGQRAFLNCPTIGEIMSSSMSTNVDEDLTDRRCLLSDLLSYVHVIGQIDHYVQNNSKLLYKINEELSGLASTNILVKSIKTLTTENDETCIDDKLSAAIELAPYFIEPQLSGFVYPNPSNTAVSTDSDAESMVQSVEDEKITSLMLAILSLRFEMRSKCAHELVDYLRSKSHLFHDDDAKFTFDRITELIKYGLC
ncbi:U11-like protein [Lissonota sp. PSUC_FEM 10030012]|nr:U11-like protein [Lissonota sp. PSUC_FEM 10030012]